MRYKLAMWLCALLLVFGPGLCRPVTEDDDSVVAESDSGESAEESESEPYNQLMTQLMADLQRAYKSDSLHAELNKRSGDTGNYKHESEESEESNEVDPLSPIMEQFRNYFNGRTENIHAEFLKRSTDQLKQEEQSDEDPFTQNIPLLMADLQRVFGDSGIHAEFVKRSSAVGATGKEEEGEDSYRNFLDQMMADMHRSFDGKTENIHAEFNRALSDTDTRH